MKIIKVFLLVILLLLCMNPAHSKEGEKATSNESVAAWNASSLWSAERMFGLNSDEVLRIAEERRTTGRVEGMDITLSQESVGGKRAVIAVSSITVNSFTVNDGDGLMLFAGKKVVIGPGFHVAEGAKFQISILKGNPPSALDLVSTETERTPSEFHLKPAYPNPFNPVTTVSYQLAADARVTLKIYDALGREVATLVDETKNAGEYTARFDGAGLSSGIYLARLVAIQGAGGKPFTETTRLMLAK